jgi:hypothetical protein
MTYKQNERTKTSLDYSTKNSSPIKELLILKDIFSKLNVPILNERMISKGSFGLNFGFCLKHIDVNMTEFYIKKYRNDNSLPISVNAIRHEYASTYLREALEKPEEK